MTFQFYIKQQFKERNFAISPRKAINKSEKQRQLCGIKIYKKYLNT